MNYKADRTPFWNQFFIAALRDAEGTIVNHVGVQCEVRIADGEEVKRGVRVKCEPSIKCEPSMDMPMEPPMNMVPGGV